MMEEESPQGRATQTDASAEMEEPPVMMEAPPIAALSEQLVCKAEQGLALPSRQDAQKGTPQSMPVVPPDLAKALASIEERVRWLREAQDKADIERERAANSIVDEVGCGAVSALSHVFVSNTFVSNTVTIRIPYWPPRGMLLVLNILTPHPLREEVEGHLLQSYDRMAVKFGQRAAKADLAFHLASLIGLRIVDLAQSLWKIAGS